VVQPERILEFRDFLRQFQDAHINKGHKPPFCFILGAGASVQSGIPAADDMVDEWLREMHTDSRSGEPLEKWATAGNLGIPGFEWSRRAEFYSAIYDRRWRGHEEDGSLYLQRKMEGRQPSYGYAVLAQLVSDHHRIIITTNFDSLASDALFQFGSEAPFVCGHERLVDYIPRRSTRPVVIKLHRDLLLGPVSSTTGTSRLDGAWHRPITRLLQDHFPIFIGYGGNDGSLMNFLAKLPKDTPERFYWCQYKGGEVNATVARYINDRRGFLVLMDGFDQLMHALHGALGLPDLMKALEEINQRRAADLRAGLQKLTETAKADVATATGATGPASADTLAARFALATALFDQGKYREAEAEHRDILALRRDKLGPEHPDTLASWHQWAKCLLRLGRGEDAATEYGKLAPIRAKVLGAEHPDTLWSRNNLANALYAQTKYAETEAEQRALLAIRERVLGAEHPDTLTSRNNLATALQAQDKYPEAEAEHRAVLAIRERVLGAEHPDVAQSCYNLALCLEAQALGSQDKTKKIEALAFARRALAIRKKSLGEGHPETQRAQAEVADLEKP
jgi:hypothetical protein